MPVEELQGEKPQHTEVSAGIQVDEIPICESPSTGPIQSTTTSWHGFIPAPGVTVSESDLLEILKRLEVELHQLETRRDKSRLDELLHPGFREFGRSGRVYSRDDVLGEFSDTADYPSVAAVNFGLQAFGDAVAMLTYTSAHVGESGGLYRYTLRSSLWIRDSLGWRMVFHQGTPTDALPQGTL